MPQISVSPTEGTPQVRRVRSAPAVKPEQQPNILETIGESTKVDPEVLKGMQETIEQNRKEQLERLQSNLLGKKEVEVPNNVEFVKYSIPYDLLAGDKLTRVPSRLNYRPLDGFDCTYLNELRSDNIDEGLSNIMDNCCWESKMKKFSHFDLPTPEVIRAFVNLRVNSDSQVVEVLQGICTDCGEVQPIIKVNMLDFDDIDMKPEYKEPFPLKVKVKGKQEKLNVRLIRSGDIYKAKNTYEKDQAFVKKIFKEYAEQEDKRSIMIQILEYAYTILSYNGNPITYEQAVLLCKDNLDVMQGITSFNNHFAYGIKMETRALCHNKKCSYYSQTEVDPRGSSFLLPLQPELFHFGPTEGSATQYFDIE